MALRPHGPLVRSSPLPPALRLPHRLPHRLPRRLRRRSRADPVRVLRSRPVAARSSAWQPVVLATGFLVLLADVALHGAALHADLAAHALAGVPRPAPVQRAALLLDRIGLRQTTVPPLVLLAVLLGRRTRSWRPVLLVSGAVLGLNLAVGVLKLALGRGESVTGDAAFLAGGQAFPSGHSSNIALACALGVHLVGSWRGRPVLRRTAVLAVGLPCLVMSAVSLALGFHWLSDLVSGVLVGLLVVWTALRLDGHVDRRPKQRPEQRGTGRGARAAAPAGSGGPPAAVRLHCRRTARGSDRRAGTRHPGRHHRATAPAAGQEPSSGLAGQSSRRAPSTAACTAKRCSGSVGSRSSACRTRARR